jgi:hypothetical protein
MVQSIRQHLHIHFYLEQQRLDLIRVGIAQDADTMKFALFGKEVAGK